MRRFLLIFIILSSISNLSAQVTFNEFYTSPKDGGNNEFFELYNISDQPVNLDCYSLVVFVNTEGNSTPIKRGFYVLDFPSTASIPSRGYFVGAAKGPNFSVQSCVKNNPDIDWNNLSSGSLKFYEYNGTGYTISSTLTNVIDLFYQNFDSKNSGVRFMMFLFDGAGKYVNGFIGGDNSASIPSSITTLPDLTIQNGCGTTAPINWASVLQAENVIATTGTTNADNGFIRINDGKCGDWEKSSNPSTCDYDPSTTGEHTPGHPNGPGTDYNQKVVFSLSSQVSLCNNRIEYAITGLVRPNQTPNLFPIYIDLYWDINGDNKLDANDTYLRTSPEINSIPSGYYAWDNIFGGPDDKYLLVFRTGLGCIDKIVQVEPVTLTTREEFACNNTVTVGLSGGNLDYATSKLFPLEIYVYFDYPNEFGELGTYDEGIDEPLKSTNPTNPIIVHNYSQSIETFTIADNDPNKGRPILIVYKTEDFCLVRAAEPSEIACGSLPVNIGYFTAVRNKQKVLLKWETLTEQSNRGFNVQRNIRGVWENRAFVFSASNGGNSTDPLEYSFNDYNNEKGVSQYRIQQVDMDGKVTYTPIRSVRGEDQAIRTIIYPNPSGEGKVNVVFEDEGSRNVIVSDINGRIIRQYRSIVNSLVIDNLDAGMYILQFTDLSTTETSVEKVIIKKR